MALTPEDVVNKRFQSTKFREGYDQDEVDDFLDEIVIELRRLGQENEELRQRLVAADARIAELGRASASGQAADSAPVTAFVEPPFVEPAAESAFVAPTVEPVVVPVAEALTPESVAPVGIDEASGTNNLLQLARRLHEEHVREGVTKRDALIAEGESRAAQVVADAEALSGARVSEVEERISGLQQEREGLERSVDELRGFEREYRASLKGFIEGQLRDLEASESSAGEAPVSTDAVAVDDAPAVDDAADENPVDEASSEGDGAAEESADDAAAETPESPFAGFAAPTPFGAESNEQAAPPAGWRRPPQAPFTGFGGN